MQHTDSRAWMLEQYRKKREEKKQYNTNKNYLQKQYTLNVEPELQQEKSITTTEKIDLSDLAKLYEESAARWERQHGREEKPITPMVEDEPFTAQEEIKFSEDMAKKERKYFEDIDLSLYSRWKDVKKIEE